MRKNYLSILACLGFIITAVTSTPALAQTPPAEFTLKISNDDVNTIGKALGKLPFDDVAGLIQKLRTQIVEQQQAKEPAKPVEAPVAPPQVPEKK